jgi:hypothetical protein
MAKEVKKAEKKRSALIPWGREHDIDQVFEDFLGRRLRPFWPERWWPAAGMEITTPTVDLYEEKDDIVVKAELASPFRRVRLSPLVVTTSIPDVWKRKPFAPLELVECPAGMLTRRSL